MRCRVGVAMLMLAANSVPALNASIRRKVIPMHPILSEHVIADIGANAKANLEGRHRLHLAQQQHPVTAWPTRLVTFLATVIHQRLQPRGHTEPKPALRQPEGTGSSLAPADDRATA